MCLCVWATSPDPSASSWFSSIGPPRNCILPLLLLSLAAFLALSSTPGGSRSSSARCYLISVSPPPQALRLRPQTLHIHRISPPCLHLVVLPGSQTHQIRTKVFILLLEPSLFPELAIWPPSPLSAPTSNLPPVLHDSSPRVFLPPLPSLSPSSWPILLPWQWPAGGISCLPPT